MSAAASLLTRMMEQVANGVRTAFPALVLDYNIDKSEARIQPLFKTKEFNESPVTPNILEDIPVLKHRFQMAPDETELWGDTMRYRPVLKSGDVVWCQIAHRSLDAMESGVPYYPGSARIMNTQDCVIVGVVKYA